MKQSIAYCGRAILSDWWYWTRLIAKEQSRLAKVNKTSRRLRNPYRISQRRFRHAVNVMVKYIIEYAYTLDMTRIVIGMLKEIIIITITEEQMIHNFWSFKYVVRVFKEMV